MLLTEAVIYLLPVFTKRKKRQHWPSTFSLHPIAGLVVGKGGCLCFGGVQRPYHSLVSSEMQRALLQLSGMTGLVVSKWAELCHSEVASELTGKSMF